MTRGLFLGRRYKTADTASAGISRAAQTSPTTMSKLVVLLALFALSAAAPKPGLVASYAVPAAVSHQYRTDVIGGPVVAAYAAAPVVAAAPAAVAVPAAVSHQSRVDVIRPVAATLYAAPVAHYGYAAAHAW